MGDNTQSKPGELTTIESVRSALSASEADNRRLIGKLRITSRLLDEAQIKVAELRDLATEIDRYRLSASNYATFDSLESDEQYVNIIQAGNKKRVGISAQINRDELERGQLVLVADTNTVIKAYPFEGHGEIMPVKEIYGDGTRAIVSSNNDDERMVYLSDRLKGTAIRAGDSLLVNPKANIAIELVEKAEITSLMLEKVPNITYGDVGGLAEQIEQIHDAVELPRLHADLFSEYDLPAPKGVLLYGPPGCGKTLIAKAIANSLATRMTEATGQEVHSYFINVKGPELLNKYVGETERQIRLIFERAREKASDGNPVVIFFDEMESMFRTRGSGISSDVEGTVVPQLLTELDGVESLENVLVIGASNRQDMIDPAILRSGRFDVKIRVDRPDKAAAIDIFTKYLKPELPLHKLELDAYRDHDRQACVTNLIHKTVDHMYAKTTETEFLRVHYGNGDHEVLHYMDFSSGAMIKSIVDRAKKAAIKDQIRTGQIGIKLEHLIDACNDEYQSNDDLPNNTNPDDWAKISHRKGEKVVRVEILSRTHQTSVPIKSVENVGGTGQYL